MAKRAPRAPLFERLSAGGDKGRGLTFSELVTSIRTEVEGLLNSRLAVPIDELIGARRTVTSYGVPDLPPFSGKSFGTWGELCACLAETVAAFEPRLAGIKVEVIDMDRHRRSLALRITANLRDGPAQAPIRFSVHLPAGAP